MSKNEPLPDHLWSTEETAHFLGIPKATLYGLIHKRTGPRCFVVGKYRRFHPADVMEWLKLRTIGGAGQH
jgi:excisionase family DNA binding protein